MYLFCPFCKDDLAENAQGLRQCPSCGFIHYDNPIPVVACLIPLDDGIVLVQRGIEPFKGEWCLPCGYMNNGEHPKAAGAREAFEETGLVIRIEQILAACTPLPILNQLVIHFLGRVTGGELRAGDDAHRVQVFTREQMPPLCFRSHQMVVEEWFNGKWGGITGIDL